MFFYYNLAGYLMLQIELSSHDLHQQRRRYQYIRDGGYVYGEKEADQKAETDTEG
jgi:hypothetical protein